MPAPILSGETTSRVLAFVGDYTAARGYPPSLREIGDAVGLRSTSAVHRHLRLLAKAGRIERTPNVSRGLRIVEPVAA